MQNGRMDIMKKRSLKKFAAGAALLLALGLLAGCGGEKQEAGSKAQLNVGIVQLVEHSALDAANKGFVDGLADKGFKENENIALTAWRKKASKKTRMLLSTGRTRRLTRAICRTLLTALSTTKLI